MLPTIFCFVLGNLGAFLLLYFRLQRKCTPNGQLTFSFVTFVLAKTVKTSAQPPLDIQIYARWRKGTFI